MKDEIVAGLQNAIEHGASLDEAVKSFINAGYNSAEVKQAAQEVTSGVSSITQGMTPDFSESHESKSEHERSENQIGQSNQNQQEKSNESQLNNPLQSPQTPGNHLPPIQKLSPKKKGHKALIITIIIILLGLLGGITLAVFFGEKILDMVFNSLT